MLDEGRAVAFDFKDYASLDHGYAATVHKAQGMTVDRVHVLATPGLDRHAAYVALSRHRASVDLHYGRDDFADRDQLVGTLSRERAKDMASDYGAEFADRRGIRVPAVQRGAGLEPAASPERATELADAVTRHGRIVRDLRFSQSVGNAYTPEQRGELAASRAALDALQPHGSRDLETAFANDLGLIREAAEGRTAATLRAMRLEAELRVDPELRADTFVQRWEALDRKRRLLMRDGEDSKAGRVADRMIGMAKGLERDPQVESILRNRKAQLGLPEMPERSVGQSLADIVGRGRSTGIGIGM